MQQIANLFGVPRTTVYNYPNQNNQAKYTQRRILYDCCPDPTLGRPGGSHVGGSVVP